jgi:hypothetical protein
VPLGVGKGNSLDLEVTLRCNTEAQNCPPILTECRDSIPGIPHHDKLIIRERLQMKTEDFLLEDYRQKAQYLTSHFSRMWTRFNFFLTIESAFFAFSLDSAYADYAGLLSLAGIILSLAWYFFGATDNYLVEVYRGQIGHTYYLLAKKLEEGGLEKFASKAELEIYSYVGDVKEKFFNVKTSKTENIPRNFFQRRFKGISATELAVVSPTVFFALWLMRIGIGFP